MDATTAKAKARPSDHLALDDQFCFAVHALSRAITQAYEPLLHDLDLTYPQYVVLLSLWEGDQVALKDLGARLRLDSGTLTPLLKRLEAKGLVTRERSRQDERALVLTLTPAGRKLRQRAKAIPPCLLERFGLPAARLGKLRDDLRSILATLEASP
jgi:DNA-binding MarR family transcriptional regulator